MPPDDVQSLPIPLPVTVTNAVYDYRLHYESTRQVMFDSLDSFYRSYIVDTVSGSFQVFQSFTYGEMLISLLLFLCLALFCLKWFWEAVR